VYTFMARSLSRSSAMIAPVSKVIAATVTLTSWRTIPNPHRGVSLRPASVGLLTKRSDKGIAALLVGDVSNRIADDA
jgi:hypothetical protein